MLATLSEPPETFRLREVSLLTAADSLIGFWREIERQGKKPSVLLVLNLSRMVGIRIRTVDAYRILEKFRTIPEKKQGELRNSPVSVRETSGEETGITLESSSRARNKVSLVPNPSLVSANALTGEGEKTAKKTLHEADLKAYAVLDALWPVLFEYRPDIAMPRGDWRKRNKAAALSLVAAGKTPEECVRVLRLAYTGKKSAFYGNSIMLDKLQEHWAAIVAAGVSGAGPQREFKPKEDELPEEERLAAMARMRDMAANLGSKYQNVRSA